MWLVRACRGWCGADRDLDLLFATSRLYYRDLNVLLHPISEARRKKASAGVSAVTPQANREAQRSPHRVTNRGPALTRSAASVTETHFIPEQPQTGRFISTICSIGASLIVWQGRHSSNNKSQRERHKNVLRLAILAYKWPLGHINYKYMQIMV